MCLQVLKDGAHWLVLACFCRLQPELWFNPVIYWHAAQADNKTQKGGFTKSTFLVHVQFLIRSVFICLQDCATMQFCANKLDKKDFFGKSDPFMVFYRSNEDGT